VLYASAIVLAVMLGWDEVTTIIVMAAATVLYTTVGGNKAVIMVDAKQMILMFAGIFVALALFLARLPSSITVGDAVRLAGVTGKWNNIDLSLDLNNPYTLLSGLVGGFFLALSYFGCDQSQVQRYLTGRSLSESRQSLIFNAFVKVPMQFLILAIGVVMFVFYHFQQPPLNFIEAYHTALVEQAGAEYSLLQEHYTAAFQERRDAALVVAHMNESAAPAELSRARQRYLAAGASLERVRTQNRDLLRRVLGREPSSEVNYIFPSFLMHYAPAGILGLLLAVLFAAAMSTFSSEINSLASATIIDFYKRYFRHEATDAHYLWVSRTTTVLWGGYAAAAACFAGRLGSLIEAVNKVGSYFYGPILGVFLLAFMVPRSDGRGAFWGLIAGEGAVLAVAWYSSISWLYYNVVGVAVVVLVGCVLGYTFPLKRTVLASE
jgi:Na+/proline symporter